MGRRSYIVEARAHGYLHWVRESPLKLLTLREARAEADRAEGMGDTIGLQARVVNVSAG